jgi:hypothetical protein
MEVCGNVIQLEVTVFSVEFWTLAWRCVCPIYVEAAEQNDNDRSLGDGEPVANLIMNMRNPVWRKVTNVSGNLVCGFILCAE